MLVAIPRLKEHSGSVLLSYGFRPFFLLASIYAALSIALWLPQFYGLLELSSAFAPVDWHIHELFFGFAAAVITGFLFTAVPNWTGRMPIQGIPLLGLILLWIAGRFAMTFSAHLGWAAAMVIDAAFLTCVWGAIAMEIVAGRNWRNLKVLIPLTVLLTANIAFHLEVYFEGVADVSRRVAMASVIAFILLIGGRIIPSFTRNWLVKNNPGRLPKPFAIYEKLNLAFAIIAMVSWCVNPDGQLTGVLFLTAAFLLTGQLARWAGDRTFSEMLVLVLHISYLFIVVGYLLFGTAILFPDLLPQISGYHALGVGAMGGMTLSVMLRATKGHTSQPLVADVWDKVIFCAIAIAAILRIIATLYLDVSDFLMPISGLAWAIAFLGFAIIYFPLLTKNTRQFDGGFYMSKMKIKKKSSLSELDLDQVT